MLACAERVSVHVFPPAVIDRDGLHKCNLRGLREALWACQPADIWLVDGFKLGPTAPPHRAIVDGDTKSAAIAAASIVAKVTRDRYMRTADAMYPGYGFASHVGYITPAHTRSRARARAVRDPPPLVAGACVPQRRRARSRLLETWQEPCRAPRRALVPPARLPHARPRTAGWAAHELDLVVRRGRMLVFCEVKSKSGDGFGDPLEMVDAREGAPGSGAPPTLWLARIRSCGARRALRRDRRAGGADRAPAGRASRRRRCGVEVVSVAATQEQIYAGLDPTSPGRSASCPSACGRSTSTGSIRISASTSRSSSRSSSAGTCPRADGCSIRSRARGRRSCRRSRAASTRPASTSPRSTAC